MFYLYKYWCTWAECDFKIASACKGESCSLLFSISTRYQVITVTCSCHVYASPRDTWGKACPAISNMKSSPDEVSLCAIEDDYFYPEEMSWRWPKIISSFYLTQCFGYEFLSKNKRKVGVKYIGLYDCMKHPQYEQNAKLLLVWKIRWKSLDWLWCCELNPGFDTCQAKTLSLRCISSPEIFFLIKQIYWAM